MDKTHTQQRNTMTESQNASNTAMFSSSSIKHNNMTEREQHSGYSLIATVVPSLSWQNEWLGKGRSFYSDQDWLCLCDVCGVSQTARTVTIDERPPHHDTAVRSHSTGQEVRA
jgi:hypothetical protein